MGAVSGSPPASVSQENSAPGSFLPLFAPNRDIMRKNDNELKEYQGLLNQSQETLDQALPSAASTRKKFRRSFVHRLPFETKQGYTSSPTHFVLWNAFSKWKLNS